MRFDAIFFGTSDDDELAGSPLRDLIFGFSGDDTLFGRAGADTLFGGAGNDVVAGGAGRDLLFGGGDDDIIIGGVGDDVLTGGDGTDEFQFDPSNIALGHDLILDFNLAEADQIVLNAADVFRADTGILGEDGALQPSDFDDSEAWDLVASDRGNLTVVHPGGTIELVALGFSEDFTFAGLVELGALGLNGVVVADEDGVLTSNDGDDILIGAEGAETFSFDPSNPDLGDDVIANFEVGTDQIVLNAADVFRADTGILGEDGALQASDFDDSMAWDLVASDRGNLTVVHPGGTIELAGLDFSEDFTFAGLVELGALGLSGVVVADEDGVLTSNDGDDILIGAAGAEIFSFDPSNPGLGDDVIANFEVGADQIVLNAADVFRADTGILGEDGALQPSDFDDSEAWDLVASDRGNLTVVHPGGTIELAGLGFSEDFTFAGLVELGALGLSGVVVADENGDLTSQVGDDLLIGGDPAEAFVFDPSEDALGDDVVVNFHLGVDRVELSAEDILNSAPGIEGEDGMLQGSDLDVSEAFDLVESDRGALTVVHPGGSIEFVDIGFDPSFTFDALVGDVIDVV